MLSLSDRDSQTIDNLAQDLASGRWENIFSVAKKPDSKFAKIIAVATGGRYCSGNQDEIVDYLRRNFKKDDVGFFYFNSPNHVDEIRTELTRLSKIGLVVKVMGEGGPHTTGEDYKLSFKSNIEQQLRLAMSTLQERIETYKLAKQGIDTQLPRTRIQIANQILGGELMSHLPAITHEVTNYSPQGEFFASVDVSIGGHPIQLVLRTTEDQEEKVKRARTSGYNLAQIAKGVLVNVDAANNLFIPTKPAEISGGLMPFNGVHSYHIE